MSKWIAYAEYGDSFLQTEIDEDYLETEGQVIEHVLENIMIWADMVKHD